MTQSFQRGFLTASSSSKKGKGKGKKKSAVSGGGLFGDLEDRKSIKKSDILANKPIELTDLKLNGSSFGEQLATEMGNMQKKKDEEVERAREEEEKEAKAREKRRAKKAAKIAAEKEAKKKAKEEAMEAKKAAEKKEKENTAASFDHIQDSAVAKLAEAPQAEPVEEDPRDMDYRQLNAYWRMQLVMNDQQDIHSTGDIRHMTGFLAHMRKMYMKEIHRLNELKEYTIPKIEMLEGFSADAWDNFQNCLVDEEIPTSGLMALIEMSRAGIPTDGLRGWDDTVKFPKPWRAKYASFFPPDMEGGGIPVLNWGTDLTQKSFIQDFVMPSLPCVIKGWDTGGFKPLKDFTNLDFLDKKAGDKEVVCRTRCYPGDQGRPIFIGGKGEDLEERKIEFWDFVSDLKEHDEKVKEALDSGSTPPPMDPPLYLGKTLLDVELPGLAREIKKCEFQSPSHMFRSCFGPVLDKGVVTIIGAGGNVTPIHFSGFENMFLAVKGTQRLFLYPPADSRWIYPMVVPQEGYSRSRAPPFVTRQMLRDDAKKPQGESKFDQYKLMFNMSGPYEVRLDPGDLLYIPIMWWRCMEGSDESNMSLNWWFYLSQLKTEDRADTLERPSMQVQCESLEHEWVPDD